MNLQAVPPYVGSRYCPLERAESHCDPVLRDAKAVHAEYLGVEAKLGCSAKIGCV